MLTTPVYPCLQPLKEDNYPSKNTRHRYLPKSCIHLAPSQMSALSLIPSQKLDGQELFFTLDLENKKNVVFFDKFSFSSLPCLLDKTSLPPPINQELLDTIATIANYLAQGTRFTYVKGTAIENGEQLEFEVIEKDRTDEERYLVKIPSYRTREKIEYARIRSRDG